MATKNTRIVGYLPPSYHQKLRHYMEAESLTESAAIVKIIKDFFDGAPKATMNAQDDAIADLRADITELQRRLMVLEQAVTSVTRFSQARSRTSIQPKPQPVLPPLSFVQLGRRLGVTTSTIEEAHQKGEAYFKDWSRRMDPTKRSWLKQGELFHPESD